jgi:hypothetical protein
MLKYIDDSFIENLDFVGVNLINNKENYRIIFMVIIYYIYIDKKSIIYKLINITSKLSI